MSVQSACKRLNRRPSDHVVCGVTLRLNVNDIKAEGI